MNKPNSDCLKSIIKIYGFNLSKVDITGVNIAECDIRNIKLRKDKNIFQKVKDKNLFGVTFPSKDYSRYNFKDVLLKSSVFSINTRLPKNRNFFQKLRRKDISKVVMPCADYSIYNFRNVNIRGTIFPLDAILTYDYNFFQKIKFKDFRGTVLPLDIIKNLHLFDLKGVRFNINSLDLTPYQKFIIMKKQEY